MTEAGAPVGATSVEARPADGGDDAVLAAAGTAGISIQHVTASSVSCDSAESESTESDGEEVAFKGAVAVAAAADVRPAEPPQQASAWASLVEDANEVEREPAPSSTEEDSAAAATPESPPAIVLPSEPLASTGSVHQPMMPKKAQASAATEQGASNLLAPPSSVTRRWAPSPQLGSHQRASSPHSVSSAARRAHSPHSPAASHRSASPQPLAELAAQAAADAAAAAEAAAAAAAKSADLVAAAEEERGHWLQERHQMERQQHMPSPTELLAAPQWLAEVEAAHTLAEEREAAAKAREALISATPPPFQVTTTDGEQDGANTQEVCDRGLGPSTPTVTQAVSEQGVRLKSMWNSPPEILHKQDWSGEYLAADCDHREGTSADASTRSRPTPESYKDDGERLMDMCSHNGDLEEAAAAVTIPSSLKGSALLSMGDQAKNPQEGKEEDIRVLPPFVMEMLRKDEEAEDARLKDLCIKTTQSVAEQEEAIRKIRGEMMYLLGRSERQSTEKETYVKRLQTAKQALTTRILEAAERRRELQRLTEEEIRSCQVLRRVAAEAVADMLDTAKDLHQQVEDEGIAANELTENLRLVTADQAKLRSILQEEKAQTFHESREVLLAFTKGKKEQLELDAAETASVEDDAEAPLRLPKATTDALQLELWTRRTSWLEEYNAGCEELTRLRDICAVQAHETEEFRKILALEGASRAHREAELLSVAQSCTDAGMRPPEHMRQEAEALATAAAAEGRLRVPGPDLVKLVHQAEHLNRSLRELSTRSCEGIGIGAILPPPGHARDIHEMRIDLSRQQESARAIREGRERFRTFRNELEGRVKDQQAQLTEAEDNMKSRKEELPRNTQRLRTELFMCNESVQDLREDLKRGNGLCGARRRKSKKPGARSPPADPPSGMLATPTPVSDVEKGSLVKPVPPPPPTPPPTTAPPPPASSRKNNRGLASAPGGSDAV